LLNSAVCQSQPELVDSFVAQGYEIASHGRTNSESQAGLRPNEERKLIEEVSDAITEKTGSRPRGWLGPWLGETLQTPELLKSAGYHYVLDWCADDQPIWLRTNEGSILSIPYSQEINDSSATIGRYVGASEFADMIIDQVDEMIDQSSEHALAFGLALHTNIVGQPFRLRQLRRALAHIAARREHAWITRACDIASYVYEKPERAV
ncbi:MAG: polysaccharide deacetylase family protein, partial [Albidovulum sp.]|nr:polysaccharide deacetylase family protein [Albidovulum sp.]